MTFRALAIGLLAAIAITVGGYFNGRVIGANNFVGNHFPLIVFGPLVLLLLGRFLLGSVGARRRLKKPELAVIVVMSLAACNIPGTGLLRGFTVNMAGPIQANRNSIAWRRAGVLDYVPRFMLPNDGRYDRQFMEGYLAGMGKEGKPIGPRQVPWDMWRRCLLFWVPLAFLMGVASVSLAIVLHQQWSMRERLNYPIAEVANRLLASEAGQRGPAIFRENLFWLGLAAVFAVQVVNGLAAWWPDRMIHIPREFNFFPILHKFGRLGVSWQSWRLFRPEIWPIMVAFGFLIAADVSLSLGLSQIVFIFSAAWLIEKGRTLETTLVLGGPDNWQRAGSCIAAAIVVLYTGRKYFWGVLSKAFAFGRDRDVESHAVWACRLFIASVVALVAILDWAGLDWPLATMFVVLAMTAYMIQARINTESGLLLAQVDWVPSGVLVGLFGAASLGPVALAITGLVGAVFVAQLQESLMPFVLNAMRISRRQDLAPRRAGWLALAAFSVALAAGVPFAMWVDHSYGAGLASQSVAGPSDPLSCVEKVATDLSRSGELIASERMAWWERLAAIRPSGRFVMFVGVGFALVLAVSALRFRFAGWPIHPIMFMVWGTWAMSRIAPSFLLGWIVRQIVTRIGGSTAYSKARPFMFGVIAGELLGGVLWLIVGMIYFAATGEKPSVYPIFPGG